MTQLLSLDSCKAFYNLQSPSYIDWNFYTGYLDKEPPFGELGAVVFLRTYSRFVPELGRREKFAETCLRVVEYSLSLDTITAHEDKVTEAQRLFDCLFNLRGFASGRAYWMAGTAQSKKDGSAAWNCCFRAVDDISAFSEVFYWLLLGAGVGFSVESKYISKLPQFQTSLTIKHKDYEFNGSRYPHTAIYPQYDGAKNFSDGITLGIEDLTVADEQFLNDWGFEDESHFEIVVGDSKEGWCNAVRAFMHLMTISTVESVTFDYNNVRPKGERIKTFGGRASGHANIQDILQRIYHIVRESGGKLVSLNVLDIVNSIGLGVVSGGVRRCLPKGTLVHLRDGLKPIEEVKKGDFVATSQGYHEVTDWVYQGVQGITQIDTQMGIFECTDKHKIAIASDTQGGYVWKQANELNPGDRMMFVKNSLVGSKTELPVFDYIKPLHSTTCKNISIPDLDEDVAYFLGYLHGDGYVTVSKGKGEVSLAIHASHTDVLAKLQRTVARFGVNHYVVHPSESDNCFKLRISSKQLALYLAQFKLAKQTLKVPSIILRATELIKLNYVAGLCEADGCLGNRPICLVSTVYESFAKEIQCLMASVGIPARLKQVRKNHEKWQDMWHVTIHGVNVVNDFVEKIASKICKFDKVHGNKHSSDDYGFPREMILASKVKFHGSWSKQSEQMTVSTLEKCTGSTVQLVPVKILSVEHETRYDDTYDLSVAAASEFVCDKGFLVHNTAEIGLGDADDIHFIEAKENLWTDESKTAYRSTRVMSNNSVVFYENPGIEKIRDVVRRIQTNGEPGFAIIGNAQKHDPNIKGGNPCFEALLDSFQSCNLTTQNLMAHVNYGKLDWTPLEQTLRLITRVGCRQTTVTQWHPIWDKVQKRDRLLGVSMTGVEDAFDVLGWNKQQILEFYNWAADIVRDEADSYNSYLGIERSARVTLVKPEGTLSQLPTVSSGIGKAYAPYYLRRVRFSRLDPLAIALQKLGIPVVPENNQGEDLFGEECNTWVFTFPLKTNAKSRAIDEPIESQFQRYLDVQTSYVREGFNASNTMTVAPDEWEKVPGLINDHWDDIIGITFLPRFDPREGGSAAYPNMPYEPCEQHEYKKLASALPKLSESELIQLVAEHEQVEEEQSLDDACATGACPVR